MTSLYFQNESNSQTLLTGAKCRSVILGGDLKDSNITLTQLPQSTDQNMQVKVGGVEPVGSPVNAVNVGKSGENSNSEDIQDASHYPCDVCHTLISIAANTECWTCTLCDDFAFCKQCQEQGLHTEHLDRIHEFVIPEINDNIYCRNFGRVFRINQNKLYQCTICDDGYILCLKCHNGGMHQKHFHYHELKTKKAYLL